MEAKYDAEIAKMAISEKEMLVIQGVTRSHAFATLKAELQKVGKDAWSGYDDLDKQVPENARDPDRGSYAISVFMGVEPNQKPKMLSYDKPKECVQEETTVLEEMLLTLTYFLTTGGFLNVKKIARCGASRVPDGDLPYVYFDADYGKVYVGYCRPDSAISYLRARPVVPRR